MQAPTLAQNIVYWAQIIVSNFIYPIGVLIILSLAYIKFSQFVDSKIEKGE